jgi:WD40 repeat protein/DNA-binding CsgD family transcriptional regulator
VIPQKVLKIIAADYGVSDTELQVLALAIEGQSMKKIAQELDINATAVRKRLGEVYKKFGIGGIGPGKLAKLQQILISKSQTYQHPSGQHPSASLESGEPISLSTQAAEQPRRNGAATAIQIVPHSTKTLTLEVAPPYTWTELIAIDAFYGREKELAELEQLILVDRCRLVALLGIGGIGKTSLSLKLFQQIQPQFERTVWQSLENAPPLKTILLDLIRALSNGQETDVPERDRLSRLFEYVNQYRCLIVLDDIEAILQATDLAGNYKEGYQDYGELIERMAQTCHQSCLVLTSAEKPKEFSSLEGRKVRAYALNGLNAIEGQEIFKEKGIIPESESECKAIVDLYDGNPLALKIVSSTIQDLFGSISEFLEQGAKVFGGITTLLDQQFTRLSAFEKDIMYWIAINREAISLKDLRDDIVPLVSQPRLQEALESLGRRSLVKRDRTSFCLQPVVMEYTLDRLVEQMCEEIHQRNIVLFNSHPLIKAQAQDYVREAQIRSILQPLKEKLLTTLETEDAIQLRLLEIVSQWQQHSSLKPGYVVGNILNLLWQMGCEIRDRDFSRLVVRQAYLQDMTLQRVNFREADLSQSVFAETLGSILAIDFSPDGRVLATGDTDYKVHLWNVITGEQQLSWQAHEDWIRSVCFSPDGTTLATGSEDQTIRLWEVTTGRCLRTLEGHTSWVRFIRFSADGKQLVSASEDKTVRLWDAVSGECLKVLQGHTRTVRSATFSPDGNIIASASGDSTVRLWDMASGKCFKTLDEHDRGVRSVAFSPNGQLLATGSSDRTVKLWNTKNWTCVKTLSGHIGWVWSVVFSSDGQTIASGSEDQTVRLWDVATGQCLKTLYGHASWVRSVAFSPDNQTLASGSDDQTVRIWKTQGQCLKTLQGYARGVRSVAFSPNNRLLASGSEDRTIRLWSVETGQCLQTLPGHKNRIWSVVFSPDGRILASGSEDHSVRLWDVTTGQSLKVLESHIDGVHSAAFSPDGRLLATGSSDHTIKLWEVSTGQLLGTLKGHTDWVWSVAFSPDGTKLASGSGDFMLRLWDVQSQQCLKIMKGHTHWIRSIAFSPDGQTLASSSVGRTVRFWDVRQGKEIRTLSGYTKGIRSVAFSPDSRTLASGSDDRDVRLWDVESGECLRTFPGHTGRVQSVAVSPNGMLLASGSNDEAIKLWDINTGTELKTLRIDRPYEGMNITGAKGLSPSQRTTLITLGAIDQALMKE